MKTTSPVFPTPHEIALADNKKLRLEIGTSLNTHLDQIGELVSAMQKHRSAVDDVLDQQKALLNRVKTTKKRY